MKVWIDRDTCESNLSACISCFGELMQGKVDRGCILEVEEDNSDDVVVYMRSDGITRDPIFIPADMREMVAFEGWDKFVNFEPSFRRNEGSEKPEQE